MTPTPGPEQIADSMRLAEMGADLPRLREVCLHVAARHEGVARERLLVAAESMRRVGEILAALGGSEGEVHAER